MKRDKILISVFYIFLLLITSINLNAQETKTKYGIVPVWPQGWNNAEKEEWFQTMSDKGMGYLHTILTWAQIDEMNRSGGLSDYINYIQHLKYNYGFKYHFLLRNPSTTVNPVPEYFNGMNFENSRLTDSLYSVIIKTLNQFGTAIDYFSVGGESDIYFAAYPEEIDEFSTLLEKTAEYVHNNYPRMKFSTVLTFEHGVLDNDTLWQLTKDFSDVLNVTYWPLNPDFTVINTAIEDVETNLQLLLNAAGEKMLVIKESGLPSDIAAGGSPELQDKFVREMFLQTMNIDQIEIVGWDFLADFDNEQTEYWINFQQIYTPQFRAYIRSLGLTDTLGNAKPGYNTYLNLMDSIYSITSVERISLNDESAGFSFYPNPVKEYLYINPNKAASIVEIKVYSILGEEILSLKNPVKINVTDLPAGIYFLKSISDNSITVNKFLKINQ